MTDRAVTHYHAPIGFEEGEDCLRCGLAADAEIHRGQGHEAPPQPLGDPIVYGKPTYCRWCHVRLYPPSSGISLFCRARPPRPLPPRDVLIF